MTTSPIDAIVESALSWALYDAEGVTRCRDMEAKSLRRRARVLVASVDDWPMQPLGWDKPAEPLTHLDPLVEVVSAALHVWAARHGDESDAHYGDQLDLAEEILALACRDLLATNERAAVTS